MVLANAARVADAPNSAFRSVAKLADAAGLGPAASNGVGVRVPPDRPFLRTFEKVLLEMMTTIPTRICKCCSKEKTLSLQYFASAGVIKGVQYYRHLCTPCYGKAKQKELKNLKKKFESYKKELACTHCGNADFRVLEFHHVDASTKENNISDLLSRKNSWQNIMTELKKCICLCANCHRIVHYVEK